MSIPTSARTEAMTTWIMPGANRKAQLVNAGCSPGEVIEYARYDWRDLPDRIQEALTYPKEGLCTCDKPQMRCAIHDTAFNEDEI